MTSRIAGAALLLVLLAACGDGETPAARTSQPARSTPGASATPAPAATCPEMQAGYLPSGLTLKERAATFARGPGDPTPKPGTPTEGVRVSYGDGSRLLTFVSGVEGEIAEGETISAAGTATVRGHEARLTTGARLRIAAWEEAGQDSPCHIYAVIAEGLEKAEFARVLAGIR